MTNLHLKPTLVKNEEPIVIHENKVKPMKRHRSFINNMKDLLMKRRQIKIIINKNFFMDKNHKLKPKIMVYDMSTSISNYMKKSDGRMANTGLVRNKKQDLTITELEDKSMEIMEVLSQLDMDQQPKVDTLSFLKEKEGGSHSETPSISEFKESLKEIEEMDVRKTKLNILTPMKLKIGIKRFQHQIIENKKKEIKSDFNHLIYTPFFFTRFFDGKLRKWRVKYCNIKG